MPKFADLEDEALNPDEIITPEERRKRQEIIKARSGEGLKDKWRDGDRSKLDKAMARNAPPVIVEPKCQVCTSEFRLWIERQLVMARSYQAIANSIPGGPSRRSISNHFREHMALDQAAVRALLEEHADLINQNYEEGVRGAITHRGMLDVMSRKAFQDAMDNVTTIEPKDLVQMVKLLAEMNEGSGDAAMEEAKAAVSIFKEAIQNILLKGEGDLVTREAGKIILQGIVDEIVRLKTELALESQLDRHLMPPGMD